MYKLAIYVFRSSLEFSITKKLYLKFSCIYSLYLFRNKIKRPYEDNLRQENYLLRPNRAVDFCFYELNAKKKP